MSQTETSLIRNLAIVGHGDTGKTSLVSAALFASGATNRFLSVDEGNSITDYDDDEIKRKISISTGICSTTWRKHKLNILDTPGFSDFICDAFPALRISDIAVFVANGGAGVEGNLERIWEAGDELPNSRIFLINRLDKENTSFDKTVDTLRNELSSKITPVAIPLGSDVNFTGIVDLISQKALKYDDSGSGKPVVEEIPGNLADQVEEARMMMIEGIAEVDDVLLEKYLEGEEISSEELLKALKTGIATGEIYPAIPVSAARNIGVSYFMDFVVDYGPSPLDISPMTFGDTEVAADPNGPLVAQIFKTIIDPYTGKISAFRIYSGTLTGDSAVYNSSQDETEKVSAISYLFGKTQNTTKMVVAGDIAMVSKLKYSKTGDTLTSPGSKLILPKIEYPNPLFSFAFRPSSKSDEEKISSSLTRLAEEDPTLIYARNAETNELIVSGMGQLHLEVTQDRLKRKYGVNANVSAPKIPFRETIKGTADVRYRHKKQSGGAGQFGEVAIRIKSQQGEEDLEFVDAIVGGVIPQQFIPSVEKGVRSAMASGVLAGYQVTKIRVELYDGKTHPVDSKDIAFQIAGAMALKEAFQKASPILLEPIMKIRVRIPETAMGDVIGDLNSKRGRVLGMEADGKKQIIQALVPMMELQMYEPELRSMTGGRGSFTMEFDHYEELPAMQTKEVVDAAKRED